MAAILGGVPAEHHGVPQAPPVGILAPCLKKPEPQLFWKMARRADLRSVRTNSANHRRNRRQYGTEKKRV